MRQLKYSPNTALCILHTCVVLLATSLCSSAFASRAYNLTNDNNQQKYSFDRISTFGIYKNNSSIGRLSSANALTVSKDGQSLIYIDQHQNTVGFIDISNISNPNPTGTLAVAGTPRHVFYAKDYILVIVNNRSAAGKLNVIDINKRSIVRTYNFIEEVAAAALNPNRDRLLITFRQSNDIKIVQLDQNLDKWRSESRSIPDLELNPIRNVDIDDENNVIISMPNSGKFVIFNLKNGKKFIQLSTGSTQLNNIDTITNRHIEPNQSYNNVRIKPFDVTWLSPTRFASANLQNRGFAIYDTRGYLRYSSHNSLETLAIAHGHFPEAQASIDGAAPSRITTARFKEQQLLFVASEQGSFVSIYKLAKNRKPKFLQFIPSPLKTSDIALIPQRNLLVISGREDNPALGVRASIMIYKYTSKNNRYAQIVSRSKENPIAWSSLSGLTATKQPNRLIAVQDNKYHSSQLITIDTSNYIPEIVHSTHILGSSTDYDLEGIVLTPDNTAWVASEGNAMLTKRNIIAQINPNTGRVLQEVYLPKHIETCINREENNRAQLNTGFQGITYRNTAKGYQLLAVQKLGWTFTSTPTESSYIDCTKYSDRPNFTKIWLYSPTDKLWSYYEYELEATPDIATSVGLLEITRSSQTGELMVVESDNRSGDFTALKNLVHIPSQALSDNIIHRNEKYNSDLLPFMRAQNGWVSDKPEGLAVTAEGKVYLVTDNQGMSGWSGETQFLNLGSVKKIVSQTNR